MHKIYRKIPVVHFPKIPQAAVQALKKPAFKTSLWVVGTILSVLLLIVALNLINAGKIKAVWYDDGFALRQKITIGNSGSAISTPRKVLVTVNTSTLVSAGQMLSTCYDTRFTNADGDTLRFYIDTAAGACNTSATFYYVELPTVAAGNNEIYMYYDNPTASSTASSYLFADAALTTNLIAFWDLEEATSATRNDAVGSNNLTNNATVEQIAGKIGNAAHFTGSDNDYLNITDNTALSTGNISFTLSAWIYLDTKSGERKVITKTDTTDANREYYLQYSLAADRFQFGVGNGAGTNQAVDASNLGSPSVSTWYHVVGWSNTSEGSLNIQVNNGIPNSINKTVTGADTAYPFYIGRQGGNTTEDMDGRVDSVGFWKRVLTPAERATLYNQGNGYEFMETFVPTSGPSAATAEKAPSPMTYWKFDEGYGTTTRDTTSSGYTGTLSSATWQNDDMCVVGKCLRFDGSASSVNIDNAALNNFGDYGASTGFTIQAWVRTEATSGGVVMFGASANNTQFMGLAVSGGKANFGYRTDNNTEMGGNGLNGATSVNDGKWHLLTATRNGNVFSVYVDGILSASLTDNSGFNTMTTNRQTVGALRRLTPAVFMKGDIDEVKLYNYARTETQIRSEVLRTSSLSGNAAAFGNQDTSFLNKDLRAYWKFDEFSGNATDSSGNAYVLTNTASSTYTTGKFANAATMNGSTQYFTIADNADISVGANNPITVSAWVNGTALAGGNRDIVTKFGSAGTNAQLEYQLGYENASARFYFNAGDGTNVGTVFANNFGPAPANATWYFVLAQYDPVAGLIKISVNGGKMSTAAWTTGIQDSTHNLSVGRAGANNFNYFNGKIDEVRIYKRVLGEREIEALYNWADGPVADWHMEEASGSRQDSSGNAQTLTENNGTTPGTHGKYGKAALLQNTTGQYLSTTDTAKLSMGNLDFTLEAWVNLTNKNDHRMILSKGTGSSAATMEHILYYDVILDKFIFQVSNGSTVTTTTSSVTVSPNTWYHLAAYYDSVLDQAVLVVNGSTVNSTTNTTGSQDLGGIFSVGASAAGSSHFGGLIDEVKVYRYVRSMKQIVEDMNGGHPAGGSPVASQFAYYKFDEQKGAVANNSNPLLSSMTGSISGAAWRTAEGNSCKFNGCLNFDGVDDIVTVADNAALDATSSGTISLWVKPSSTTQDGFAGMVTRATGGAGSTITYSLVWRQSDGVIQGGIANGTTFISVPMPVLTDTNWHHIAFTWDRTALKLYKDGMLGGTTLNTAGITAQNTTMPLNIGGDSFGAASGTDDFWNGSIDEVKVYNSALTANEILIDANGGSGTVLGAQNTYSLENSLYGYWKLDETAGTRADSSGQGNTLTNNNSVATGDGKYGLASAFTAASSMNLSIADNPSLSTGNIDFTITAWVYRTATGANDMIMSRETDGTNREYIFFVNTSDQLTFRTYNAAGTAVGNCVTGSTVPASTWTFVAGWYDASEQKNYCQVNNEPVYAAAATDVPSDRVAVTRVGGDAFAALYMNGRLDEVRYYRKNLSAGEREQLYNNRPAPAGYWSLDEKTSTTASDKTGNGYTGTLTAGPVWSSGKVGGGITFDGVDDVVDIGLISVPNNSDLTVSAWVNMDPSMAGATATIFAGCNDPSAPPLCSGGDYDGILLRKDTNDKLFFSAYFFRSGANNCSIVSANTVPLGRWTHVAVTFDENDASSVTNMYIDGIKQVIGSNTCTSMTSAATSLYPGIGALKNSNNGASVSYASFFKGKIDDVRFYLDDLTQTQVTYDYNRGAPVAHYKLDECNGTSVYNTAPTATGSGTIFNGTIVPGGSGNTSAGTCGSGTSTEMWNDGTTGKRNASLGFDGTDDYVVAGNVLKQHSGTEPMSVAAWIKTTSVSALSTIIDNKTAGTNNAGFNLQLTDTGLPFFRIANGSSQINTGTPVNLPEVDDGEWHHLVGVLERNQTQDVISLYVDGVQRSSMIVTAGWNITSAQNMFIGAYGTSASEGNFPGSIDDIRIYTYALTASQVKLVYNDGAVTFGPETGSP